MPNGVAFKDGTLYVAEVNRIIRFDNVLAAVKPGMRRSRPPSSTTSCRRIAIMDGSTCASGLTVTSTVPVGAPCNICERPDPYASILRVKPDGSGFEVFARGVRNTVGFTWHPDTRELWFTDNGRDMLGDDQPNDELNVAAEGGAALRLPVLPRGNDRRPGVRQGQTCADYQPPAQKLGPHVAPLGLALLHRHDVSRRSTASGCSSPSTAPGTGRRRRATAAIG